MGSKKFTFLELHLDGDTQLGPKTISDVLAPETGTESEDVESRAEPSSLETDEHDDSGRPGALGVVIGLGVLVGIAVAVKKFRGDDEDELEDREEPDVIVN